MFKITNEVSAKDPLITPLTVFVVPLEKSTPFWGKLQVKTPKTGFFHQGTGKISGEGNF